MPKKFFNDLLFIISQNTEHIVYFQVSNFLTAFNRRKKRRVIYDSNIFMKEKIILGALFLYKESKGDKNKSFL